MALFSGYVMLCLALPGLLLIRALYGGSRTLAEEIALGLALGYAIEVLAYIVAQALGAPLLVLVWPISTYAVFLATPRLRRHWKGAPRPATPFWWSWSLALAVGYLVAWSAHHYFSIGALTWPDLAKYADDMPFHLSLIGELKHHVPPMNPMVAGEPAYYHWFVYAHYAAASWITGVEPLLLVFRLGLLPMLAAFVVLVAMLGRRVTGSWMGAQLAVAATIFVGAPRLYLGSMGTFTSGGIHDAAWGSPTFTFGSLLFIPVVLLAIDLLKDSPRNVGAWFLLAVFLVAVMGAKATYLPMLIVGLAAVATVEVVKRRRPPWCAMAALGMTAACLLFSQFVLFGGRRQGMVVAPFSYMRTVWQDLTAMNTSPPLASLLGITLVYLLAWAVTWSPVLGLLSRPRLLTRPDVVLLISVGAAGLGAVLMLDHPGRSQLYFLWGSYPYLAIVAAYGLLVVLRRAKVAGTTTLSAIGVGVFGAYLIPILCGVTAPLDLGQADGILYRPYIALLVIALLVAAVLVVTRSGLRGWALAITALAAMGLPAAQHARVLSSMYGTAGGGHQAAGPADATQAPPQGVLSAGRWLRAHSDPDDLVATNVHCRWGLENPCDSRQFWVSALTERHMLVEGWAFTATNADRWRPGQSVKHFPFWDQERYKLNEAAFLTPSTAAIRQLKERYGVRWLFVDEHGVGADSRIGDFAPLRFRSGDCAVYEI